MNMAACGWRLSILPRRFAMSKRTLKLVLLSCVFILLLGAYHLSTTGNSVMTSGSRQGVPDRMDARDETWHQPQKDKDVWKPSGTRGSRNLTAASGPVDTYPGFRPETLDHLASLGSRKKTGLQPPALLLHTLGVPKPPSASASADRLRQVNFNPRGNATLVFVHIQKTSGTVFQQHLVSLHRRGTPLCFAEAMRTRRKKEHAVCPRTLMNSEGEPWLVTEKVVGWFCGVHATYTEMKACLRNPTLRMGELSRNIRSDRNFLFMTILRHPVLRYLSEYFHIQRGAHWSQRHRCGGRLVKEAEMPPCYPGFYENEEWPGVTLEMFMSCDSNWANNRQTMQLADLDKVGCYNRRSDVWEKQVLASAKENLARFVYFGLAEYEVESGLLFEKTFGLEFGKKMEQRPLSDIHSAPILQQIWKSPREAYWQIVSVNRLDWALYEYALDLFESRLFDLGISINRSKVDDVIATLSPDSLVEKDVFTKLNYTISIKHA